MSPAPAPRDRVVASLLAGAIGDALGAPIEFDALDEIRGRFGPAGLTTYAPSYGRAGAITDDTQMTLFTAEGLLRARAAGCDPATDAVTTAEAVHRAYLRWLITQEGVSDALAQYDDGWLLTHLHLHSPRAPGLTCLSALRRGRMGTTMERANDSKGCGGVMRVAPAGVAARGADAFRLGADCAAVTHGHPTGYLSAGVLALVVSELVHGTALADAVATARRELVRHPRHEETARAIDAACTLATRGAPSPEQLESLGGGWVAEEALAIALCAALTAGDDLRAGLLLAVNHSGDTDSTGAIAGNLLGASLGVGAIPAELLDGLELRDLVERIGHDLADAFVDGLPVPSDRYPPN